MLQCSDILPMDPMFPCPQATSSTTFKSPPLDGSLTIPEIYDFHLQRNGNHPLFVYDGEDGSAKTVLWRQAVQAIYTAAWNVKSLIQTPPAPDNVPVVAILAVTGQSLILSSTNSSHLETQTSFLTSQ